MPELIPQKIVCGVCGAERYYRYLKQARKFGVYSCETCRKFITKTINQGSIQSFTCLNGSGKYIKLSNNAQILHALKVMF